MAGESTVDTELSLVELLVRSGLVDTEHLDAATKLSESLAIPLIKVLQNQKQVTEAQFAAALEFRKQFIEGAITRESAFRMMLMVAKEGVGHEIALARVEGSAGALKLDSRTQGMLELLMFSGAATKKQVERAILSATETGLSVSRILLFKDIVTRNDLKSAFAAQRLIRDGLVEKQQAIIALKLVRLRSLSLTQALKEISSGTIEAPDEEIGAPEYLVIAGALPESQLLTAKEIQLLEEHPRLDELMIELGYTTRHALDGVEKIVALVQEGSLYDDLAHKIIQELQSVDSAELAESILERAHDDPDSFEDEEPPLEISDILLRAGLITYEELDRVTELALADKSPLIETMHQEGLLDDEVLEHASYLKTYLDHNLLKQEQAIIILIYSIDNQLSVEETMDVFGW